MLQKIFKIGLLILITTNLIAYDIEKEGKWWYVYNGNDVVGAYTDYYGNGYKVACGNPTISVYDNKYIHRKYIAYIMDNVNTAREARLAIENNCKKR